MAGEFDLARETVGAALARAAEDPRMSPEVMQSALLQTVLVELARHRTRKDLQSLVEFQLESCGEDEFVITRGC